MKIYVDELRVVVGRSFAVQRVGERCGHRWCHLWAEKAVDLHAFAARLGLQRDWVQDHPGFPHYVLTPGKRAAALRAGAVEKGLKEWWAERAAGGAAQGEQMEMM